MTDICHGTVRFREFAKAQDAIGWRRFLEGMITSQLVSMQAGSQLREGGILPIGVWASGLVIKLMECTHGQWLYRNVVVHDNISGVLATAQKEDLQVEIEEQ